MTELKQQMVVKDDAKYANDTNWDKAKVFNLKSEYLDAPIKVALQSGLVVFSFGGRLLKDAGSGDVVLAKTTSLAGFPLPTATMRGLFMDITAPDSSGGAMGVLAWYEDGRVVMNLNKTYKASLKHYFNASLTAVTNAVPVNGKA